MATWKCLHKRTPAQKIFAKFDDSVIVYGAEHAHTLTWRRMFADELRQRQQDCPACAAAKQRARSHWAALVVAGIVLLVLGLATCSAKAQDACAPTHPVDGRTCAPPKRLAFWGMVPVCVCRGEGVAYAAR